MHLRTRAALFDELSKIAEVPPSPKDNKTVSRKWLKNAALFAAGTGSGTAAFMIADKLVGSQISPQAKAVIVGLAAQGGNVATRKLMELYNKE